MERPIVRLLDGDVIELGLLPALTDPKAERWEGVRVFFPDILKFEGPDGQEPMQEASLLSLLFSKTSWPKSRDFASVEIHRVTDGKLEKLSVDLVGQINAIPRFDWDREKLLALNVPLKSGDLVVVPKEDNPYWAGRYSERYGYSGVLKEAITFLSPAKPASPPPTRAPSVNRGVPGVPSRSVPSSPRRRVVPTPPPNR